MRRLRPCCLILSIWLSGLLLALVAPAIIVKAAPERIYFKATGHFLQGKFLQYWQIKGGLSLFGYPITPEFYENGYLVQYFERNRFELHPENSSTSYEVLLGLLGRERLDQENRPLPKAETSQNGPSGASYFKETGFDASGPFLQYWQKYGGLAQFGFPISPVVKDLQDGRTVQYFERARFELHPENSGTDYLVLFSLLGRTRAASLDPVLFTPWQEAASDAQLVLSVPRPEVHVLDDVTLTANMTGEIRLLGSDNRQYAAYQLAAGVPLTLPAHGLPGTHSVMLLRDGKVIAARWNLFKLDNPTAGIDTGDPVWDGLYPRVKGFLEKDRVTYYSPETGWPVSGYRSPDTPFLWLRDHIHQQKGFKFFEPELRSALDYFRTTQRADGSFDDYIQHFPGYEVYKAQIEIEADREYLFVEGVYAAWQATGDDTWLRTMLPAMMRGLEHTFSDPRRWSSELGLVKRGFTIDTWDFEQGSDSLNIRRSIDDKTRFSIMHGDNTGAYQAARLLASMLRYTGSEAPAQTWESRASRLLQNLMGVAWNGNFLTHQVHLTPVGPTGVDEARQLSLSNAYALNRGVLTTDQAARLIKTYQLRRDLNGPAFVAEWYSIDPPFKQGFGPPGEYVNGGIMPLVGGELARGAFEYGFEDYAIDILLRYWQLIDRSGGSYLWYYPDGRPGIITGATLATDGWGSSAMLNALTEGLAGVVDNGKLYQNITLAPRWAATGRTSARVTLGYAASGSYFSYNWQKLDDGSIKLGWGGAQTGNVKLHLLLPKGVKAPQQALLNGQPVEFKLVSVQESLYLDASLPGSGTLQIS